MGQRYTIMSDKNHNSQDHFEKQLDELEQIINRMEDGDLSLESSIKEFEQGIKLANDCQKTLSQAELKVKILLSENDSELANFDVPAGDQAASDSQNN